MDQSGPERAIKIRDHDLIWVRKSHQDPGVRFGMDKSGLERIIKIPGYDLIWIRMD